MNPCVRGVMDEITQSGCFGEAGRQYDLLKYLLTEKDQGRLKNITQYSIAVDVLGRLESFDATSDSIVRVEMHRLRKNLERFNLCSKNIRLTIPRASFEVIVMDKAKNHVTAFCKTFLKPLTFAATAIAMSVFSFIIAKPNILAKAIASNCSSKIPNVGMVNSGISSNLQIYVDKTIQSSLSQYTNINFVDNIEACSESGAPSFTIDYLAFEDNGIYRIALITYHEQPSNIVGVKNIRGGIDDDSNEDINFAIATSIGEFINPYGSIPRYAVTQTWKSQSNKQNYRCLITMYDSFDGESDQEYSEALSCLKASYETGSASLDNLGGLATSYLEQVQGYRSKTVDNPILAASKIIDSVGEQWINSAEMTIAKIVYEVERPDFNSQRLKSLLNDAETRYKSNPQVLITVAIYSGYKLGDWKHAKSLSDRVKRIHSGRENSVFIIDAAYAILYGSPEDNMQTCKLIYSENSLIANIIINACAKQAHDKIWMDKTHANLRKLRYSTAETQIEFIKQKNLDLSFSHRIISALSLPPI